MGQRAKKSKRSMRAVLAVTFAAGALLSAPAALRHDVATAAITNLPAGFQSQTVFSGLNAPTNFAFSPDGRVFVTEKRGVIKVFDGLDDPTPTVFADLQTEVMNYSDRGLLGLALAPNFPVDPYVYVSYSLDGPIGTPQNQLPVWGDTCNTPPGPNTDGCTIGARVSRLQAGPNPTDNVMVGTEQILIEDWCQQFPSHSIGSVEFGSDGALYVGGGEGANFNTVDYGQYGGSLNNTPTPRNPCGDPPGTVGGPAMSPPTAEGGALRSQDLVTSGDPTSLDGSIIRVNPATGAPLPDNPNAAASDVNARRIVAMGMRNPFRFTFRPGTTDLWIGDVGWGTWEEVNRHSDARASVKNFGWPCYEGTNPNGGYQPLGLALCDSLYNAPGAVTPPVYAYSHFQKTVPNDPADVCPAGGGGVAVGSAISGISFYNGGSLPGPVGSYPSTYDGALFFADYSRQCISVLLAGANGLPDPTRAQHFASGVGVAGAVALHPGPGGDIFWADIGGGSINRIRYYPNNRPPQAVLRSDATAGSLPLTVHFDASDSTDADGDPLTYKWDLDNDGNFNDGTGPTAQKTFNDTANHTVRVLVTDAIGATDTASVIIHAGNNAPSVTLTSPTSSTQWKVGDTISFSATGTDNEDGTLPASAYNWSLVLEHCPDVTHCHQHPVETFNGVSSGSFIAPDHEYPARLLLAVTVADSGGVTASQSVELFPQTTTLTLQSNPAGAIVAADDISQAAPLTKTVIVGSKHVVTAPLQQFSGSVYDFDKWSDFGQQTHTVTVSNATNLNATFSPRTLRAVDAIVNEGASGTTVAASIPVRLNAKASRSVTVAWATENGTAGASDYTPASGTLVFPAGTTQQNIQVNVAGDGVPEGPQTFGVRLSAPQNADIVRDLATVTIQDDPTPIANAGPDQTNVKPSTNVTVDGSLSSDTNNSPLTYVWTQIDGPVATIEDRNAAQTRVTVPTGPSTITLRLTVTNASGKSSSDDITITIAPK